MDTKERIIESSLLLFLKYGGDNVSLTELKKASNITSGGLYHLFSSKEELISEVKEKFIMDYFKDVMVRIYDIEGSFKEKIGKIMYTILGFNNMFLKQSNRADEYYKKILCIIFRKYTQKQW
ncbi:hypothetical protein ALNOE001_05390 [Candidatus Methanobinarius endosymbioticus]|uniref:HTH tetR-type domain-containing protein n=1 Tax=Candidatus Methanobinarius endosymbioticus TaxID=2006182 RepID=A0A366MCN0_9EURY|nr:hypothetical protein ALNOE001_05390 [Candidatus Methanobinarius endosymbioticus]